MMTIRQELLKQRANARQQISRSIDNQRETQQ
jgi:hypothetical protein